MKKLILTFTITALLLSALTFTVGATEAAEITEAIPTEAITEAATEPATEAVTEPVTDPVTEAPVVTEPIETEPVEDTDGEERIPLDEFLLRLWDEYRDTIFAVLSSALSLIVALVLKNKYIPGINREIGNIFAGLNVQSKRFDNFTAETKGTLSGVEEKIKSFENYDNLAKDMKEMLEAAQLDRRVLIKTIELQADQIEHLIEYSHLSQARKDQLYEGYREQLEEIKKLKGDGESEA
jgi:hypothetical protein